MINKGSFFRKNKQEINTPSNTHHSEAFINTHKPIKLMKRLTFYITSFILFQLLLLHLATRKVTAQTASVSSGNHAHFIAFFITSLFVYLILIDKNIDFSYPMLGAFTYAVVIATAVELIQLTIPHRTFDVKDIYWGVLGSIVQLVGTKLHTYIAEKWNINV